jgi:hypothetical protein
MPHNPLIAIVGSVNPARAEELDLQELDTAVQAAEDLGRELARAGCRILVYSSHPEYVEHHVVRGYLDSGEGKPRSIQVRYPLSAPQPDFPDQAANKRLFDWRPSQSRDWEVAFYRSLEGVDGLILIGGGSSTLVSGLVAMGHRIPILALAAFGGAATTVWQSLSVERDLATRDDIALMARPGWTGDSASELVAGLLRQRRTLLEQQRRDLLERLRQGRAIKLHAALSAALFVAALAVVPLTWGRGGLSRELLFWALFFCPVLGGVSGATIRLVFDFREGTLPLTTQSALTTAALGLVAGGIAGLLFITAQMTGIPSGLDGEVQKTVVEALQRDQAKNLVPFALAIGFLAGLTLDAVFRRLIRSSVLRTEGVEVAGND